MKYLLKEFETTLSFISLGAIYGGSLGIGIALSIGDDVLTWALTWTWAWAWVRARSKLRARDQTKTYQGNLVRTKIRTWAWAWALSLIWAWTSSLAWVLFLALAFSRSLSFFAEKSNTAPEKIVNRLIVVVFLFPITLVQSLLNYNFSVKNVKKLKSGQKDWDASPISVFTQGLAEVFPEEWDEWQHWISDIMGAQKRMQSKGTNRHLVSLITFYRLTRFAFHIGIDKVFILATRRATR